VTIEWAETVGYTLLRLVRNALAEEARASVSPVYATAVSA
jgi:hypothetical protein